MSTETVLRLTGIGIPDYSARGIEENLRPIGEGRQLERTWNGGLEDVSEPEFRKFASTLTCRDMDSPALDGVWPGQVLSVDCITELCYLTTTGGPAHEEVEGSERQSGDFTFYRPRLTMMVTDFRVGTDEWGAEVRWTMELEEV